MKKLMIAAVTAAVAGGAFATTLVYDYKASVTHMYDKLVNVRNTTVNPTTTVRVYQKFKKTATLQGYLIVDDTAYTSQRLNASGATVYDQGRNRAFLVVRNSSAEANVRAPKIMPAVIDAKRIDTKFSNTAAGGPRIQNGIAEGILFVGGDLMAYGNRQGVASATSILPTDTIAGGVRPKLEARGAFNTLSTITPNAAPPPANTITIGTVMPAFYADYAWTSCYLFGEYNGPQWSGLWQNAQLSIDSKQRIQTNNAFGLGSPFYHDTWLNHAGIGTYTQLDGVDGEICCGLSLGDVAGDFVLDSLSGNFKGGIFLCSDDGFEQRAATYNSFLATWWEDQFWAPGISQAENLGWVLAGDYDQPDVWTDGDIELNTTDVAYGSWSIKRTTRLNPSNFTAAEIWRLRTGIAGNPAAVPQNGYAANNIDDLNGFIKGAFVALQGIPARFVGGANNVPVEIHNMNTANRFTIPFLTPKFAQAYGLVNVYVANP